MKIKRWLLERELDWERIEFLLQSGRLQVENLTTTELHELTTLYRGLINDLARAQSIEAYRHLVPYLNNLAQRTHARLYASPGIRFKDIWHYFMVDYPQCFRRNKYYILASFLAFLAGAVISMTMVWHDPAKGTYFMPQSVIDQVKQGHLWIDNMSAAPSEASFLMTNNIRVSFMAYGAGILFGVGTLYILFSNGMQGFGGPLQICINNDVGHRLILFMIPHGIIELTTVFVAGAAGMMIGLSLLFPGHMGRWEAMRSKGKDSLILISGCVPMLIIAGLIEGLVSLNGALPDWIRIAVSLTTAIGMVLYLGFAGRGKASTETAPQTPVLRAKLALSP